MLNPVIGAHPTTYQKVGEIRNELIKNGYSPRWFIISQKRYRIFNKILDNSVPNSNHLKGKAIDLFVLDIDGDGQYDAKDFRLIQSAVLKCRQKNIGKKIKAFDYFGKGYLTQHMVDIEVLN
ncbi:MAG: hypothetical protein KGP35_07975 [Bacteroidetes bacterium]|nr:hypothetical protein [Bacteroidota bacterium]